MKPANFPTSEQWILHSHEDSNLINAGVPFCSGVAHHLIKGISFSNNNGVQDQHFGIHDGNGDYADVVQAIVETNWKGLVAFETRNQTAKAALGELALMYRESLSTEIAVA